MATATWDTIFDGRPDLIRKMLFGSVLIKDYDASMSLANFTPFEADGSLSSTLLDTWKFTDMGYLDENGLEFTPTYTTADTNGWQSRMALRTDVTEDTEECHGTFLETSPLVDAVYASKPIASAPALGAAYSMTKNMTPQLIYRTTLFLGIDGSGDSLIVGWKLFSKCLMTKPDKQSWQAKTEVQRAMTFTPYPDPVSKFAIAWGYDGPGWRALGNTGAGTGTGGTTTP